MANTFSSPAMAPRYALHRSGVTAVDAIPTNRAYGCNAGMYRFVHVQVVPSGGANPNVTVWWWSEGAGKFVQEHTSLVKAGVGLNTPYEFTLDAMGRTFFVGVTTLTAGTVDIYTSGFQQEQASA